MLNKYLLVSILLEKNSRREFCLYTVKLLFSYIFYQWVVEGLLLKISLPYFLGRQAQKILLIIYILRNNGEKQNVIEKTLETQFHSCQLCQQHFLFSIEIRLLTIRNSILKKRILIHDLVIKNAEQKKRSSLVYKNRE